jgi:ATP phosphoribosyltransferase regulatory subunit
MTLQTPALLPAGLRDLLPPEARLEMHIVRQFAGFMEANGYDLVKPPLVEFEETLLAGSAQSLTRQTYRLMDPLSQRMMAFRTDMTPQVARIASSRLGASPRPLRLAYTGEVLRISGTQLFPERQFCQLGCELIGSDSAHADAEMVLLAAGLLNDLGVKDVSIDINLPRLIPNVLKAFNYPAADADEMAGAIERRDLTRIRRMGSEVSEMIARLITIGGPVETSLKELRAMALPERVQNDLVHFERTLQLVRAEDPGLMLTIDPIERRGFEYQTGLSFTIYSQAGGELGRGGRYRVGGKSDGEPATGFTLLTENLLRVVKTLNVPRRVYVMPGTAPGAARSLREQGYATVRGLSDGDPTVEAKQLGCGWLWDGELKAL